MTNSKTTSSWFDPSTNTPLIAEKARQLESFLSAIADGIVDDAEVKSQEDRLVKLMKEIEPLLDESLHAKITSLLCELTAYEFQCRVLHSMQTAKPTTKFRG